MHTEMCTVNIPTANIEEMFSYIDCVDASGNFLLPTCNASVTQVFVELVGNFHLHVIPTCITLQTFILVEIQLQNACHYRS